MTPAPVEITVEITSLYNRGRFPQAYMECTGPDGRRFTNSSLTTLREVLQRQYGKALILHLNDHRPAAERRGRAARRDA